MSMFHSRFLPLTDFISRNAQWYPDKAAIIFEGERLTWCDFSQRVNRVARYLIQSGVTKGDRVALINQNCLEYPEIMFGILKSGGVLVPISAMLKKETVLLELQDAKPKAIFAGHPYLPLIKGSLTGSLNLAAACRILISGHAKGWTSYTSLAESGSAVDTEVSVSEEDSYNIIYSSGTTGIPKGIVHTHYARLLFALTCGLEFRIHNEAICIITTPIYSNGTQLTLIPTIMMGGTLVIMPAFDPLTFLKLVQNEKCTHAFMVPTQFIRIMAHPQFDSYDTSSVEMLLSAAAPLRKETKIQILSKFPESKMAELYGVTEGISTVLRPNEQFAKLGSVGKPRLGGDIKIINDQGQELPPGEIGEIVGFNFSMMKGYHQNPEMTEEVMWHDPEGRQYLKTGDIGRLDSDGYLYILDRKKDMIISGGMNIFPSDIEEVIMQHSEVAEAAVIGVPHQEWGETPLALIVKRNPASAIKENDLKDWINDKLAKYQRIAAVEFRPSLPKNDLEKILKKELRESYWKTA